MRFFIAGSDTEVGKTFVSIGIARAFLKLGQKTTVYKPIAAGTVSFRRNDVSDDALQIKKFVSPNENIPTINPITFKLPMAPYMEQIIKKKKLKTKSQIRKIIINGFRKLSKKYKNIIVEGIGGVLAPICKDYFCIDIASDLNLSAVIVTRPTLGTINHTGLTIEACKNRNINVIGIIINYHSNFRTGAVEKWNPAVISNCFGVDILGTVPHFRNLKSRKYNEVFTEIANKIKKLL